MYPRQTRQPIQRFLRFLPAFISIFMALILAGFAVHPAQAATTHIDRIVLNGDINPGSTRFLINSIQTAENDGAQALVIEIDTPGGDLQSMKTMTQAELSSHVPIITFVSPTGGRAASAGAFVALAAPIAAMSPTTRIGASSPVTSTGGNIDSTLLSKIENDLVASMTGIQSRYGRNVDLATKMVTNAASYDDTTAVSQHIVDISALDLNDLLNKVDGRVVTLAQGNIQLHTSGASIQTLSPGIYDSLYNLLLDPNIAFLLFIVAVIGIYVEISHPGLILPGVVGGIALLLFLFSAGSLAPNWTGLALMALAFVLLVLDLRLPTHGVLTIGAIVSLVLGALIFFNSGGPEGGPQVNPLLVYITAAILGLLSFTLIAIIVRVQRTPVTTGKEGMIGAMAVALTPLVPEGRVRYGGEDWSAVLVNPSASVDTGSEVRIVSVEGLRLHVQPVHALPFVDTHTESSIE